MLSNVISESHKPEKLRSQVGNRNRDINNRQSSNKRTGNILNIYSSEKRPNTEMLKIRHNKKKGKLYHLKEKKLQKGSLKSIIRS